MKNDESLEEAEIIKLEKSHINIFHGGLKILPTHEKMQLKCCHDN